MRFSSCKASHSAESCASRSAWMLSVSAASLSARRASSSAYCFAWASRAAARALSPSSIVCRISSQPVSRSISSASASPSSLTAAAVDVWPSLRSAFSSRWMRRIFVARSVCTFINSTSARTSSSFTSLLFSVSAASCRKCSSRRVARSSLFFAICVSAHWACSRNLMRSCRVYFSLSCTFSRAIATSCASWALALRMSRSISVVFCAYSSINWRLRISSVSSPHFSARPAIHSAAFATALPIAWMLRCAASAIGLKMESARLRRLVATSEESSPLMTLPMTLASRPRIAMTGVALIALKPAVTPCTFGITEPACPAVALNAPAIPSRADL